MAYNRWSALEKTLSGIIIKAIIWPEQRSLQQYSFWLLLQVNSTLIKLVTMAIYSLAY